MEHLENADVVETIQSLFINPGMSLYGSMELFRNVGIKWFTAIVFITMVVYVNYRIISVVKYIYNYIILYLNENII